MRETLFIILICSAIFYSCQGEEKSANNEIQAEENLPINKKNIYRDGLDFVRLGDRLADLDLQAMGFDKVGDSLEEGGGYMWLARTIEMSDGPVVLEGSFIDDRQYSDERLSKSLLNRIRIASPAFKTAEQVSVGMSLEELQSANEGKEFFITPLPREGLVDLEDENGHIHYLVEADMTVFSIILEQANPISVIPPTNKIKYIVVM